LSFDFYTVGVIIVFVVLIVFTQLVVSVLVDISENSKTAFEIRFDKAQTVIKKEEKSKLSVEKLQKEVGALNSFMIVRKEVSTFFVFNVFHFRKFV
jgi:hypothetical protein